MVMALSAMASPHDNGTITARDITLSPSGDYVVVNINFVADQLKLGRNHQVFVTPYIEDPAGNKSVMLPTYLFNGRSMHYTYLRSGQTKATGKTRYDIAREIYSHKALDATVEYTQRVAMEPWMLHQDAVLRLNYDTCGCGRNLGSDSMRQPLNLNPVDRMLLLPYPTPDPTRRKPINHHGRSRVQFEVNRIELHTEPYRCKSGQLIDNREQLQIIEDSIRYAISDPNVEIESITICGYASPETPFEHNDYLATNRSRALSEYIAKRFSLPAERCRYTAVTENWGEFREQVLAATDITEQQRRDLLELIDRPCTLPAEYDAKEATLKTDPRFAKLYAEKILPQWFPILRCTQFDIRTQLKPLTPIQLREVMEKTPDLMSLDEIYLVANSYEHGSEGFLHAMAVALQKYPEDAVANANAAAVSIEKKDYAAAEEYLKKAGDGSVAEVLRGICATWKGDFKTARQHFLNAGDSPEAKRNLKLINF